MEIDRGAADFPYEQLAAWFRERIRSGEFPPGKQLPSVTAISGETGAAAKTIRHAMKLLEAEGLVRVRPNRGTFVR
jgi:DNA-binding GntR family transcriptional regulator